MRPFLSRLTLYLCAVFLAFCLALPAKAQDANSGLSRADSGTPAVAAPMPADDQNVGELLKKMESDATVQPAPAAQTPSAPATAADSQPQQIPVIVPQTVTGAVIPAPAPEGLERPSPEAIDVPPVPALPPAQGADDNLFFDSESLAPEGEMRSAAPRKVNPETEPASKLIVVTKDYGKNSLHAQLVSAQRAIQLRRYDAALRLYDAMYEKNKRDPNVLLGRAVALQKVGETDEAIHAYEELLDVSPNNLEANINMLGLLGERYPAVALERLRALSDKNPDNVTIMAQTALIEAKLGDYDDALQTLGAAASLDPNNASHVYNLAVIADRAGKKEDAIEYYQKALEVDAVYGGSRSIPRDSVYERLAQLR